MVQIIQGNNLRCLFAEAPPSTTHSAAHGLQYAYGVSDSRQSVYSVGDRTSFASTATSTTLHAGYAGVPLPLRNPTFQQRSHILMVSDDRIMALQLVAPPTPDSGSYRSQR